MTYLIDTNIFLRTLINENEPIFQDCLNLLTKIKENKIKAITQGVVISEIIWTLSSFYKFPKPKVLQATNSIINLNGLKIIDNYNHNLALDLYSKHKVKYIDALIASNDNIQSGKWAILSYDKDFDKLGITRKQPNQI